MSPFASYFLFPHLILCHCNGKRNQITVCDFKVGLENLWLMPPCMIEKLFLWKRKLSEHKLMHDIRCMLVFKVAC